MSGRTNSKPDGKFFLHAAQTDAGIVRETNEDSIGCDEHAGVFVIADGLGGHQAGEVASRIAVDTIIGELKGSPVAPGSRIRRAVAQANRRIQTEASRSSDRKGMGTTLVAAICRPRQIWVAHIGDSRAYLHATGKLSRLTEDHTLASYLVKSGEITESQARVHPMRNMLDRSLGNWSQPSPEIRRLPWKQGDCLLLCSDGLHSMVDDARIERVLALRGASPAEACQTLIHLANQAGGLDNISVIVICRL
jgi:protein phosphatase